MRLSKNLRAAGIALGLAGVLLSGCDKPSPNSQPNQPITMDSILSDGQSQQEKESQKPREKTKQDLKQGVKLEDYLLRDNEVVVKYKKALDRTFEITRKNPFYVESSYELERLLTIAQLCMSEDRSPLYYEVAVNKSSNKNDFDTLDYANYRGVLHQLIWKKDPESDSVTIARIKALRDAPRGTFEGLYSLGNDKVWVQLEVVPLFGNNIFDTPEESKKFSEGIEKYAKRCKLTLYF